MFSEHGTQPTIANDFKIKTIQVDTRSAADRTRGRDSIKGEHVRLFVWDTAGQERFRQIARMYYRESQGVIICFDITNQESFDTCDFWIKDIEKHAPENALKILCGLKSDLSNMREVDNYKAEAFAKSNNMTYFEVSNKTGDKVDEMFQILAQQIYDKMKIPEKLPAAPVKPAQPGQPGQSQNSFKVGQGSSAKPMPVEKKGCC